jgi:hypothetical protein
VVHCNIGALCNEKCTQFKVFWDHIEEEIACGALTF